MAQTNTLPSGAGVTTEELMDIATRLADLDEAPLDSGVHVPGTNIRRVIFALDVNVGLLVLAKQLGYDAVIGHHPCATLLDQGEVYREHYGLVTRFGLSESEARAEFGPSLERTVRRLRNRRLRSIYYESPNQTFLEVDAARMLGLAFLNIHNACDELGRRIGQDQLDSTLATSPDATVGDLLTAMYELPETRIAARHYQIPLELAIGDPAAPDQPGGIRPRLPVGARARHHPLLLAPRYTDGHGAARGVRRPGAAEAESRGQPDLDRPLRRRLLRLHALRARAARARPGSEVHGRRYRRRRVPRRARCRPRGKPPPTRDPPGRRPCPRAWHRTLAASAPNPPTSRRTRLRACAMSSGGC